MLKKKIAVIGSGAAGCFCAVNIMENAPECEVFMFEASASMMTKLSFTGGGRCNITNTFEAFDDFKKIYPRGYNLMRALFFEFNNNDVFSWFSKHNLELYAQDDGRVFPVSNNAFQVVETLKKYMLKYGVKIFLKHCLTAVSCKDEKFLLTFNGNETFSQLFDSVIITTGGGNSPKFFEMFQRLGIEIISPAPSLFSFKIKSNLLTALQGQTKENCSLMLAGQKFHSRGGILITHFGFSGPAVLTLSSYASRFFFQNNYKGDLVVNWVDKTQDETINLLNGIIKKYPQKNVCALHLDGFSSKLWEFLLTRAEIPLNRKYSELGKKTINKLVLTLTSDVYHISGRGQSGGEFVTSGGVDLKSVNKKNLEAKTVKNLFFAGEVLDIDAITGGYNLQAAWTTAKIVSDNFLSSNNA